MDVLTQLEQACAHGCVLLSESFAVALRPADPALVGDGVVQQPPFPAAADDTWVSTLAEGGVKPSIHNGAPEDDEDPMPPRKSITAARASHSIDVARLSLATTTAAVALPATAAPSVTVRRLGRVPTFNRHESRVPSHLKCFQLAR